MSLMPANDQILAAINNITRFETPGFRVFIKSINFFFITWAKINRLTTIDYIRHFML